MTSEQFNDLVTDWHTRERRVLNSKATEYARGDRLSNFHKAAAMNGETAEKALWGMVTKHIIALRDFIYDLDEDKVATRDQWWEKIGDIRNYMLLLDGLIEDRFYEES